MTKSKTILDGVAEKRAEVLAAQGVVNDLKAELLKSSRTVDRAIAELTDYHSAVERGDRKADAALEGKLSKAVQDAQAEVLTTVGPEGKTIVRSPAVEAKLEVAREKRDEAENAVMGFAVDNAEELQAELLSASMAGYEELVAGIRALESGLAAWSQARAMWSQFEPALPPGALGELPAIPFDTSEIGRALAPYESGVLRDPRRLVPAPKGLLEAPKDLPEPDDSGDIRFRYMAARPGRAER